MFKTRKKQGSGTVSETAAAISGEEDSKAESSAVPEPLKGGKIGRFLKRVGILLTFFLVFLIGLTVLCYPSLSNYVNQKNQSRVVDSYGQAVEKLTPEEYSACLAAARAYNEKLAGSNATVKDAFTSSQEDEDKTDEYWSLLDIDGDGVMGYIDIEKIKVHLPIYHGTADAVLAFGVGHVRGSTLPVGGENTHAVLSAHTGLPSAELFTGLDQLKEGDTFTITILNEKLTYQVDRVETVLPYEVDSLGITQGKDFVTLVTCTPYGINTHRLLVRGTRVDIAQKPGAQADNTQTGTAVQRQTWFQKLKENSFKAFAGAFEAVATWTVKAAEWGMDLFGISY